MPVRRRWKEIAYRKKRTQDPHFDQDSEYLLSLCIHAGLLG